jgi:4'-phosphopantetheinyl transferase
MGNFETKAYIARTDALWDDALFEKLYHTVSRGRRAKIDSLRFRRDQCLSLAAELLLMRALRDLGLYADFAGHADFPDVVVGKNGKPRLNADGIFYNLSHAGRRALCVISPYEVGCDVEQITDLDLEIAKRFFCPAEYELLLHAPGDAARRELFFRLWTLKESFVKQLGTGMETRLDSFEMQIRGNAVSVAQPGNSQNPQDRQNRQNQTYCFQEYDFQDGYKYAVCALAPHFAQPEFVTLG